MLLSLLNFYYIALSEVVRAEGKEILIYLTEDKGFILTDHASVSILINTKLHYNKKVLLIDPKDVHDAYNFLCENINTSIYEMAKKSGHIVDVEGKQIKLPKYRRRLKSDEHKQAVSKLRKKRERENQATRDMMRMLFGKRVARNIARRVLQPSGIELINSTEYEPMEWEQKSFILQSCIFNDVVNYFYNQERKESDLPFPHLSNEEQKQVIDGVYANKLVKKSIPLPTDVYTIISNVKKVFHSDTNRRNFLRFEVSYKCVQILYVDDQRQNLLCALYDVDIPDSVMVPKKELLLKLNSCVGPVHGESEVVSNELIIYTDEEENVLKASYEVSTLYDNNLVFSSHDLAIDNTTRNDNPYQKFMASIEYDDTPSIEKLHTKLKIPRPRLDIFNLWQNSFFDIYPSVLDMYVYCAYPSGLPDSLPMPIYVLLIVDRKKAEIKQVIVKSIYPIHYQHYVEIINSLFYEDTEVCSEDKDLPSYEQIISEPVDLPRQDNGPKSVRKFFVGSQQWQKHKAITDLELSTETPLYYLGVARKPNVEFLAPNIVSNIVSTSTIHSSYDIVSRHRSKPNAVYEFYGKSIIFTGSEGDASILFHNQIPKNNMVIVHKVRDANGGKNEFICRLADIPFEDRVKSSNWCVLDYSWGPHKNKFKMAKHGPVYEGLLAGAVENWEMLNTYGVPGFKLGFRTAPFYNAYFYVELDNNPLARYESRS